jgi:hypothetical protein
MYANGYVGDTLEDECLACLYIFTKQHKQNPTNKTIRPSYPNHNTTSSRSTTKYFVLSKINNNINMVNTPCQK